MAETSVVVDHTRLTAFIADALCAMKMPRERAAVTAELMVRTDLRGVDSHGIDMLPRYHELWQDGFVVMDADAVLEKDSMATGLYDGAKGLGHWVSSLAMKSKTGVGCRVSGVGSEGSRISTWRVPRRPGRPSLNVTKRSVKSERDGVGAGSDIKQCSVFSVQFSVGDGKNGKDGCNESD